MHYVKTGFFLFLAWGGVIFPDDWNGADYAQYSSVQTSHAEKLLKNLNLQPNDWILDLGCGDGKITAQLAKQLPQGHVIGLDPSDSMLEKAINSFPNLCFIHGRAEDFSFESRFDHILAIHVMHWVKDQKTALANIYKHLKPNGQIHFILSPSKEGLPFYNALQKTLSSYAEDFIGFENPQQVFDIETYRKLLVDAGFHIDALHYVYHESVHEDRLALQSWIQQWLPYGKHLSEPKKSAFFEELMNHYPDQTRWGEYVLIIQATKPTGLE